MISKWLTAQNNDNDVCHAVVEYHIVHRYWLTNNRSNNNNDSRIIILELGTVFCRNQKRLYRCCYFPSDRGCSSIGSWVPRLLLPRWCCYVLRADAAQRNAKECREDGWGRWNAICRRSAICSAICMPMDAMQKDRCTAISFYFYVSSLNNVCSTFPHSFYVIRQTKKGTRHESRSFTFTGY